MNRLTYLIVFLGMVTVLSAQNDQTRRTDPTLEMETLQYLEKNMPVVYKRMMTLKKLRPRRYRLYMNRAMKRYQKFRRMNQMNPLNAEKNQELMKLENQIELLVQKYKQTSDESERKKLESEIRMLLDKSFDLKTRIARTELQRLEKRLEENRRKLKRREENKSEIVDHRLSELLLEEINW